MSPRTKRGKWRLAPKLIHIPNHLFVPTSSSATETKSMPAPSTTSRSTPSNKKTLANHWLSSTSTAWWPASSQTSPTPSSPDDAPRTSWSRPSTRLKLAPTRQKAASTWNRWEKSPSSWWTRWRTSQPSPFANRSMLTFKHLLWPTSRLPSARIFQNRTRPSAVPTRQQPLSQEASLPQFLLPSLASAACSNHAPLPPSAEIKKVLESLKIPFAHT